MDLECHPGGRELMAHGASVVANLGNMVAASNGMGLDCHPDGRELLAHGASNGTRLDYLPGGREPGLDSPERHDLGPSSIRPLGLWSVGWTATSSIDGENKRQRPP